MPLLREVINTTQLTSSRRIAGATQSIAVLSQAVIAAEEEDINLNTGLIIHREECNS